jgi:phosphatidylglycerophosphate synthase
MPRQKFKKVKADVKDYISDKKGNVKAFSVPRPKYISKITFTDKFFAATLLHLFPASIFRPNQLTTFRLITIPFIIWFLFNGAYTIGLVLFVLSALSDALDGAMARTRNQITDLGIVLDPIADKFLIGSVGFIVISTYLNVFLAALTILLEILMVTSAYIRFKGEVVPAKIPAKIKMILQCFGVGFLLLYMVTGLVGY